MTCCWLYWSGKCCKQWRS